MVRKLRFIAAGCLLLSCYGASALSWAQEKAGSAVDASDRRAALTIYSKEFEPAKSVRIGFRHTLLPNMSDETFLLPLKPSIWAGSITLPEVDQRLAEYDIERVVTLSDFFKLPNEYAYPEEKTPKEWARVVRTIVARSKDREGVLYDIWNEPDAWEPFQKDWNAYLEMFGKTHNLIRSIDPNAVIVGPSIAGFSPDKIESFMDYALANDLQVDVLSWHEFRDPTPLRNNRASLPTQSELLALRHETTKTDQKMRFARFNFYPLMSKDAQQMRELYVDSSKYERVGVQQIQVQEILPAATHLSPAHNFAYLYEMEKGQVDAVMRACWDEASNTATKQKISNCWNGSLNGLLSVGPNNSAFEKRAAWWVYRLYAGAADLPRFKSASDTPELSHIVHALEGRKGIRIIVSGMPIRSEFNAVEIAIPDLPNGRYESTFYKVSRNTSAKDAEPEQIAQKQIQASGGLTATLPMLDMDAVYFIDIVPGGANAIRP